jgi:hypothetical protein
MSFTLMPTFVLIGHCGPDAYLLRSAISRAVPGAAIVFADDQRALETHLQSDRVLLINRVLEGGFATDSGIEMIDALAKSDPRPAMLLISNYADAQAQAVSAGAMIGFGKRDANSARAAERLRAAAQAAASSQTAVEQPRH